MVRICQALLLLRIITLFLLLISVCLCENRPSSLASEDFHSFFVSDICALEQQVLGNG
jgi:hypothetical protein